MSSNVNHRCSIKVKIKVLGTLTGLGLNSRVVVTLLNSQIPSTSFGTSLDGVNKYCMLRTGRQRCTFCR